MSASECLDPLRRFLARQHKPHAEAQHVVDEVAMLVGELEHNLKRVDEAQTSNGAAMWLTLRACMEQFRFYEKQHRAKGTPAADEKAAVNAMRAEACERVLSGIEPAAWEVASMFWNADSPEESRESVEDLFGYMDCEPGQVHEVQAAVGLSNFFVFLPETEDEEQDPGILFFTTREAAEAAQRVYEMEAAAAKAAQQDEAKE